MNRFSPKIVQHMVEGLRSENSLLGQENATLRKLVELLDRLLVSYRTSRPPSARALDEIAKSRKKLEHIAKKRAMEDRT